ncbi:MAG: tetratricopeptide repeat protein, partial [Candidatus Latescibacteria bacterium]|nr:tetratricopeptide repeat protein [Candidatus Latescibacterota bacterium]
YQEALTTAQQMGGREGNPESAASARFLIGNSYFKLASLDKSQEIPHLQKALEQYEKIVNEYPKSLIAAEALFQVGVVYNRLGLRVEAGVDKSIDAFVRYAKQYPQGENAPFALYYASWGYYRLGDWDKAASSFETLVERFSQHDLAPECLFRAGEALFNTKKFDEAMIRFQRLANRYPKSQHVDAALYSHAWSLINLHREAEAVPIFQRIVAEYPQGKYGTQSQFTLGDYYYSLQQYDKATEEYQRFLQVFPQDRVMVPRAQMLLANLAEIDAYSIYEKGTELFDQNKYTEAMEIFKEVVQKYPNSKTAINARLNIAAAYQAREEYAKARDEYLGFLREYQQNSDFSQQVEFAKAQLEELKKVL